MDHLLKHLISAEIPLTWVIDLFLSYRYFKQKIVQKFRKKFWVKLITLFIRKRFNGLQARNVVGDAVKLLQGAFHSFTDRLNDGANLQMYSISVNWV